MIVRVPVKSDNVIIGSKTSYGKKNLGVYPTRLLSPWLERESRRDYRNHIVLCWPQIVILTRKPGTRNPQPHNRNTNTKTQAMRVTTRLTIQPKYLNIFNRLVRNTSNFYFYILFLYLFLFVFYSTTVNTIEWRFPIQSCYAHRRSHGGPRAHWKGEWHSEVPYFGIRIAGGKLWKEDAIAAGTAMLLVELLFI